MKTVGVKLEAGRELGESAGGPEGSGMLTVAPAGSTPSPPLLPSPWADSDAHTPAEAGVAVPRVLLLLSYQP